MCTVMKWFSLQKKIEYICSPKNETLFLFLRNVEAYYFLLKKAKFYYKTGTDNKKKSFI